MQKVSQVKTTPTFHFPLLALGVCIQYEEPPAPHPRSVQTLDKQPSLASPWGSGAQSQGDGLCREDSGPGHLEYVEQSGEVDSCWSGSLLWAASYAWGGSEPGLVNMGTKTGALLPGFEGTTGG